MFCMGNPDKKKPQDIIPLYFDNDDIVKGPSITQEEIEELQAEMAAINSQNKKE